jgi:hypothetical protein
MTLATTKQDLQRLLADKESKVIALSGLWGTGKSHLWEEAKKASNDPAVKNSLYVSLFGIADMATLKLKIVQSAVPAAGGSNVATDLAKTAWKEGTKVLRTLHAGFAALDELALLAVPAMLRNRFVVLDDIERKHAKLSIEEVMGFIDEFTQRFGSRFLLILNTDELGDRPMWDTFLEKVVDQEVTLATSPEEAFEIAARLSPSPFAGEIRLASLASELTNIRVIRKVIRLAGRILDGHGALKPEVLQRVVPSTVLLAAIRYKGIADGPDARFVLEFNSMAQAMTRHADKSKEQTPGDEERAKQSARWSLLMDKLGISNCDEYEALLTEYLNSGSYEIEAVAKILDRYTGEANGLATRTRIGSFFERSMWHPELSDEELLADAKALLTEAGTIDASTVTALHDRLVGLADGPALAAQFVAAWVAAFKARNAEGTEEDPFRVGILHPDIEAALKEARDTLDSRLSLAEVTSTIVTRHSWGRKEEAVMKGSTVDEYERAIRGARGHDLKVFMLGSMELYSHRGTYETHFGPALRNFLSACQRICANPASERLAKLIRIVFGDAKLASELDPPAAVRESKC